MLTLFLALKLTLGSLAFAVVDPAICAQNIEASQKLGREKGEKLSRITIDAARPDTAIFSGVVTTHLVKAIESLPKEIRRLALENSSGGDAIAGMMAAKLIREKGLDTYVGLTLCHSACTILFQAGRHRIADPNALFSYHGPSRTGESDACSDEIRDRAIEMVVDWGFNPAATKIFHHNAVINYLSGEKLLENGVAHELRSLNIGSDESIRKTREARESFCEKYPDHFDCD
jgi:hypothetical protein